MKDNIRKNDSLVTSTFRIREDMKKTQGDYNDKISDLAVLTKGELNPAMINLMKNLNDNKLLNESLSVFDKIDGVLLEMEDIHKKMGELISVVGGLEFSTSQTSDRLYEILRNQENQQNRMSTGTRNLIEEIQNVKSDDPTMLEDDLKEFFLEFSRFQDFVIEAVPRMNKMFDELDKEEKLGYKYGESKKL